MSWNHLSPGIAQRLPAQDRSPPLTMVTIAIIHNDPGSSAFYGSTALEMLMDWARTGHFILALVATDRTELTLVCIDPVDAVTAQVNQLPLIEAGIAFADIRAVTTMRFEGTAPWWPVH